MASYTFTTPDSRLSNNVLRGRHIATSDLIETATWQQIAVPPLPSGIGVLQIDLAAGAPSIRVSVTNAPLGSAPVQGLTLNAGQSLTLGVQSDDVINVRTA
jgi:hypothetical protein